MLRFWGEIEERRERREGSVREPEISPTTSCFSCRRASDEERRGGEGGVHESRAGTEALSDRTPGGAVSGVNRAVSDSRVPHYVWVRTKRSYRYSVPSAIGLRYIWLNQTACKWNKYPMWLGHVSANTSNNAFQNFLGLRFLACSASYFSDMLICMILNKR